MITDRSAAEPASSDEPDIDLRRLRYFIAVCDHGGISKAANAIGIAQPALTRHIKLLEKEIGMPLIHRSGRGAEPSRQGQLLLDRSRGHFDSLNKVVREVRHVFSSTGGHVSLGICPTIAPLLLEDVTSYLRDNHPNVVLSVIQAYSGDLQNLMRGNRLDIALTYHPDPAPGVESIDLFSERLVLVAGTADACSSPGPSLAEIAKLKLILPSRIHELRRLIDRACKAKGIRLDPALELDSLDAVKAILKRKSSCYATLLPYHSVKQEVLGGQLHAQDVNDPAMRRIIAVVMPANPPNTKVLQSLVTYVRTRSHELKRDVPTLF